MFSFFSNWKFFSFKTYILVLILTCSLLMLLISESIRLNQTFTDINQNESKIIEPLLTENRIIVFDIDSTLCKSIEDPAVGFHRKHVKCAKDYHPECPIIGWANATTRTEFSLIFLPYLQILFGFLLEQGTRIAFFSNSVRERDELIISALLTSFWGNETFETLRAKGQFDIHTKSDMRQGKYYLGEGSLVKDLKTVIRDGESLSNVILVDDDCTFIAHDQQPFVYVTDLTIGWDTCKSEASKNSVFYMLGLFKTYFHHERYKKLPLREAFKQILPKNYVSRCYIEKKDSFERRMINIGLSAVQKQIAHAKLYEMYLNGTRNTKICTSKVHFQ